MKIKFFMFLILIASVLVLSTVYLVRPAESPERTAEMFTKSLFKVAPPLLDRAAIKTAIDRLSDKAKGQIKSLADIAYFAGIQELPDRGYNIIEIYKKDNRALVKMRWNYSGGPVLKNFYMVFEKGRWKIDRIKTSKI